jgi:bile acid:Na+ symporter, BASS family
VGRGLQYSPPVYLSPDYWMMAAFVSAAMASGTRSSFAPGIAGQRVCNARSLPLTRGAAPCRSSVAPQTRPGRGSGRVPVQASASMSNPEPETLGTKVWNAYVSASTIFTNLFPVWTLAVALAALRKPALFTWLTTPYFTLSLGILMLSMGITLSIEDFKRVLRRFNSVAVGFAGCYIVMPVLAIGLVTLFKLSPDLAAGTILVGAVNGGQASNLCTYIANGNVALSVMMTTATTLGAMVFTPLIAKFLIGTVVPVDAVGIAISTVQVVLLPIVVGMLMNKYCNKLVKLVVPFTPVMGIAATCLLVGSSVAQCATPILAAGWALQIPILLLHVFGGIAGYVMQALAGYGEIVRRTTAIETSMKSSAFGFLLASLHFKAHDVRVPAAVSVVWMALVGSTMAVIWRYIPVNATLKFDRSVVNRKGFLDRFLKPSASSGDSN